MAQDALAAFADAHARREAGCLEARAVGGSMLAIQYSLGNTAQAVEALLHSDRTGKRYAVTPQISMAIAVCCKTCSALSSTSNCTVARSI